MTEDAPHPDEEDAQDSDGADDADHTPDEGTTEGAPSDEGATEGAPSDEGATEGAPSDDEEAPGEEPSTEETTDDGRPTGDAVADVREAMLAAESAEGGDGDEGAADAAVAETQPAPTDTDAEGAADEADAAAEDEAASPGVPDPDDVRNRDVPADVAKYDRFKKMDGAQYERVNEFLRDRTYITAREWAIARLCSDFRTETGVEMTKIGENLPELVPFMTDTYTPQAVNQARASFEEKVRTAGATFLYGAMCDFFTAEELDDVMYESTEVAKFLLEVEGVDLSVDEELAAEDRISATMREVRSASDELRHEGTECPECGHHIGGEE
jgi:hypothetical protein